MTTRVQKLEGEKWNYTTVVGSENFQVTEVITSPRQVAAHKYLEPMVERGYTSFSLPSGGSLSGTFGHPFWFSLF